MGRSLFYIAAAILMTTQVGGKIYQGSTIIHTASSSFKLNVTVAYERCFGVPALHVGVWARVDSSLPHKFSMIVHTINILSFEALLKRTDVAAAWNYTSIQVDWQAYHSTASYNRTGGYNIFYTYLSYNITWSDARAYCESLPHNRTLCTASQICPNKHVLITGTAFGDRWTPIKDNENNWLEMGNDYTTAANRLCFNHLKDFKKRPEWGIINGACPPWDNEFDPCYPKGHVFCCQNSSTTIV